MKTIEIQDFIIGKWSSANALTEIEISREEIIIKEKDEYERRILYNDNFEKLSIREFTYLIFTNVFERILITAYSENNLLDFDLVDNFTNSLKSFPKLKRKEES